MKKKEYRRQLAEQTRVVDYWVDRCAQLEKELEESKKTNWVPWVPPYPFDYGRQTPLIGPTWTAPNTGTPPPVPPTTIFCSTNTTSTMTTEQLTEVGNEIRRSLDSYARTGVNS